MPKYSLRYRTHFDAAHFLLNYEGKCRSLHGHRWEVEICAAGDKLDGCGMLVDFSELKKVVDEWDHQCLNEIVPVNPTAENLAELLLKKLSRERGFPVTSVTLWESPGASVAACSE